MVPPAQHGWARGPLGLQLCLGPMQGHPSFFLRLMDTAFSSPVKVVHILELCFYYAITLLQAVNVPNAAVSTLDIFVFNL